LQENVEELTFLQSHAELRAETHIWVEIILDFWNHQSGCYSFILAYLILDNYCLESFLNFTSKLKSWRTDFFSQSHAELRDETHIWVEIICAFWNHQSGCYLFILAYTILNNYGLEISLNFILSTHQLKRCSWRKILKNKLFCNPI